MKKAIYTSDDGSLIILNPGKSIDLDRLAADIPEGVEYEFVHPEDIPTDKTFRNAWKRDTGPSSQKIGVDSTLARDITLNALRKWREGEFARLSKEKEQAGETLEGEEKATRVSAILAEKQALRDITEELKALDTNKDGIISAQEAANRYLPHIPNVSR